MCGFSAGIEGTFDGPVVRQAQLAPLGIVESGRLRAGSLAFEETPIGIEIYAART